LMVVSPRFAISSTVPTSVMMPVNMAHVLVGAGVSFQHVLTEAYCLLAPETR
jgi:hypothetical protein